MASSQAILADIDLLYRNTFTVQQKLVWFNEEQVELFDILELDSPPYTFQTVEDEHFYPFPDQFDITKIKVVTFQGDDTIDPHYDEIYFRRNDDYQNASYSVWYTVTSDAMYLYALNKVPGNRNVYVYCDSDPQEVTVANIGAPPDLPMRYKEILKLGILKRIAMARKDIVMYNNYTADYEGKITDILLAKKLKEPNWLQPTDAMPKIESNLPWPNGYPWWPTSAGS